MGCLAHDSKNASGKLLVFRRKRHRCRCGTAKPGIIIIPHAAPAKISRFRSGRGWRRRQTRPDPPQSCDCRRKRKLKLIHPHAGPGQWGVRYSGQSCQTATCERDPRPACFGLDRMRLSSVLLVSSLLGCCFLEVDFGMRVPSRKTSYYPRDLS
jgi:hypothetical protein